MGQLDEKVAIVTGAGQGLGRAIAEADAAEGAGTAIVKPLVGPISRSGA